MLEGFGVAREELQVILRLRKDVGLGLMNFELNIDFLISHLQGEIIINLSLLFCESKYTSYRIIPDFRYFFFFI